MSDHVRSRCVWEVPLQDQESSEPVGAVLAQQPSDEQAQQEEPPTEGQHITPDKDNEDGGPPEAPGPAPETDHQDLAQQSTGDEVSHGAGSIEALLQKFESICMPDVGPDLADTLKELAQPMIDGEGNDGPEVHQELVPKLETIPMPDTGNEEF